MGGVLLSTHERFLGNCPPRPGLREQCSLPEDRSPASSLRAETITDRCGFGPGPAPLPWRMTVGVQTMDASEEVGSHGTS